MKIVILGAKGMLAHALADVFQAHGPILWDRDDLDIGNIHSVYRKLGEVRPTHIINATGYTDVNGSEANRDLAMLVNGDAVGYLASAASVLGATLVHYSTDYVFSGTNPSGYEENDQPSNPVNTYGESKLLGEKLIQKFSQKETPRPLRYYLIRTSWLYGPHGKNFVAAILNKAKQKEPIKVVNDERGKPTYTRDLAHTTREIIEADLEGGIYHVTNETSQEGISWFEFAQEILQRASRYDARFAAIECASWSARDYAASAAAPVAPRPAFSMLRNTKLKSRRPWQEALDAYLREYFTQQ